MLLSTYFFLRNRLFFENSLFMLPRQPIKLRETDKSLITVENYSINISVKINSIIPYETVEIFNFLFSHYKSIETISCHSNQSSYPTEIKNTIICRGQCPRQVCQVSAPSSLRFLRRRLFNIFRKFTLYVAPSTNQIKRFGQKSYETWRTTQYFCKEKIQISPMTWQKLSISTFPIISLWEL